MIDNTQDFINSRDVIARIEELQEGIDPDSLAELTALLALAEQGEDSPDWQYGEELIRDSYFTTYAVELGMDVLSDVRTDTWPLSWIDWDRAADELQSDYTPVNYDGVTYWLRS